jgi:hypothetical protein
MPSVLLLTAYQPLANNTRFMGKLLKAWSYMRNYRGKPLVPKGLVSSQTDPDEAYLPPNLTGVVLGTALSAHGIPFHLINGGSYTHIISSGKLSRAIESFTPDVICVSTTYVHTNGYLVDLISHINNLAPGALIVGGGPFLENNERVADLGFDFIIRGHGEEALPALIKALHDGKDPTQGPGAEKPGTGQAIPARVDFNEMPLPDWDIFWSYIPAGLHEDIRKNYRFSIETPPGMPLHMRVLCLRDS